MGWSSSRIIEWAKKVGDKTALLVEEIMDSRQHQMLGWRSCLGIMRLSKEYPRERLESACGRALALKGYSYRSVKSILEKGLDRQRILKQKRYPIIKHANIRGGEYFNASLN